MKFAVVSEKELANKQLDILACGVFSKASKIVEHLDKTLDGYLLKQAHEEGFMGKPGQFFVLHTLGKIKAKAVLLVGLGDAEKAEIDTIRKAAGSIIGVANRRKAKSLGIWLPTVGHRHHDEVHAAIAEGALLASYRFDKYISEEKPEKHLQTVSIFAHKAPTQKGFFETIQSLCDAVYLTRDLINEGPIVLTPAEFAKRARSAGEKAGLKVEVHDERYLEKERMNLMLAVARASSPAAPPRLIKLSYRPRTKAKKHIALVGKGVTFDCGGLDLKPSAGMLDMKIDMSGAAAVLGTMLAVAKLKPSVAVTGYLGCVENGVGSGAYHPGDILVSRKGLSVEINNTDAEGRLVLADVIDYALDKDKPDILIDLATLTGACVVALGTETAAVFTEEDALCDNIIKAGKTCGESFWRLPLNENYYDQLKTPIADLKNSGERWGGAITAALFLKKFINDSVKWVHLDIAGPASMEKDHPYIPRGGVGFPVRTLAKLISDPRLL